MKNINLLAAAILLLSTSVSFSQNWSLAGNAGTTPPSQYLGTSDNKPLVFKIAAIQSGYLDSNTFGNTGFGFRTLVNHAASRTTAIGYKVLTKNTYGTGNTGVGYAALSSNIVGNYNTAIGYNALFANTGDQSSGGGYNVAVGAACLEANTLGYYNVSVGMNSLRGNINGVSNSALGMSALLINTSGSNNTANGFYTLSKNTTGYSNTAIGANALFSNTTGANQVAVGDSALYKNTSGTGSNTALGSKALYSNTTGFYNTGIGTQSLYNSTTGSYNVSTGFRSMYYGTTGLGNTATGMYALYTNQTGNYNTAFGYYADVTTIGATNATAIGYSAKATASNQVRIGNSSVTSIGGYQPWTNLSDGRYKKDIQENVPGLSFINKLRPVTYHLDITGINRQLDKLGSSVADKPLVTAENAAAIARQEKAISTGFVAQEVEQAAKDLGYEFDGVDAPKNDNDFYGLRYSEFVVPLVKAVQELSQKNDALTKQNEIILRQNETLQNDMEELKQLIKGGKTVAGTVKVTSINTNQATLGQNIPNPSGQSTVIPFTLPQNCTNVSIAITQTGSGKLLQTIPLSSTDTQLVLNTSQLITGAYVYSLYANGKLISSKQMVVSK